MNFDLSEEQQLLQKTVAQFLDQECPPTRLREIFDGDAGFDPALWKGLAEMGVVGVCIPEEYGGAGLEILDLALVSETLGRGAAPVPYLSHALASLAIAEAGSEEQKKKWLPGLAAGELIATVAWGETGSQWQPGEWSLESGTSLTGVKTNVPFASSADLLVVGVSGGGFAVVERGAAGVSYDALPGADRTRRIEQVTFESTPCEVLPGGPDVSARVRDAGLVMLSADAFGGASRCIEMSVDYAKTREQFGVTIGHFQALKHQLANMTVEIEPARGLYWYAAHAMDHVQDQSERTAAIAKAHLTERFMQVARDTVEAHGGIGFTWECDVQIWFKRAMFDRAFLGAPALHRERAAALAAW